MVSVGIIDAFIPRLKSWAFCYEIVRRKKTKRERSRGMTAGELKLERMEGINPFSLFMNEYGYKGMATRGGFSWGSTHEEDRILKEQSLAATEELKNAIDDFKHRFYQICDEYPDVGITDSESTSSIIDYILYKVWRTGF